MAHSYIGVTDRKERNMCNMIKFYQQQSKNKQQHRVKDQAEEQEQHNPSLSACNQLQEQHEARSTASTTSINVFIYNTFI